MVLDFEDYTLLPQTGTVIVVQWRRGVDFHRDLFMMMMFVLSCLDVECLSTISLLLSRC